MRIPVCFLVAAVVFAAAVAFGLYPAVLADQHLEPPGAKKQGPPSAVARPPGDETGDETAAPAKTLPPKPASGPKPPSLLDSGVPDEAPAPPKNETKRESTAVSAQSLRALGFDELLTRAKDAANTRRGRLARLYFKEVVRRKPSHFLANLQLGRLLAKKSPRTAYEHLETARRILPRSQAVHLARGAVLEVLRRNLDAVEAYRKVIFLNPRHYDANNRIHRLLRRIRQGKTLVDKAAESFAANPSLATLTLFGRIVMENSTPREASLKFDLLSRRHSDLPEIHLWQARARNKTGDQLGELKAYESFLSKRPYAHGVRLLLIERFNDQGRYLRAEALLIPFAPNKAGQHPAVPRQVRGRFYFLHSRALARLNKPAEAGRGLLLAHRFMEGPEPLQRAYSEIIASFPGSEGLREAYGDWMHLMGKPARAAEAWVQSAQLDSSRIPRTLKKLAKLPAPKPGDPLAMVLAEWYANRGEYKKSLALLKPAPQGRPVTPHAALVRGRIHYKNGNFEIALEEFLQYLMSFTSHLDILHARGNLFWNMGRPQKALGVWLQNSAVMLKHPRDLLKIAEVYQGRGETAQETAIRQRISYALPGNVGNRIRLGDLLLAQGQPRKALLQWKNLTSERPGEQSLLLKIGRTWASLDQSTQAFSFLEKAAGMGKLDLKSTELYGGYLYQKGRYREALVHFRHLFSLQPDHPALPTVLPELVAKIPAAETLRMSAARMAIKAGRRESAERVLNLVVENNPRHQEARMLLANLLLRENQADRAVSVLLAGGPATQNNVPALKLLARAQQAAGQLVQLAATLQRIQTQRPQDFRLARRRASLLSRLGRYPDARSILEAIWKADRSAVDVVYSLVRIELKMGMRDAEEKRMIELLAHHPNHEPAQRKLIRLWVRAGKWGVVLPWLSAWVKNHPRDAIARYNLIVAHLQQKDTEGGRPHFEALKKLDSRFAQRLKSYFP